MINVHDHVRVGAVGGDTCEDTFKPGSVTVISKLGNMVTLFPVICKHQVWGSRTDFQQARICLF